MAHRHLLLLSGLFFCATASAQGLLPTKTPAQAHNESAPQPLARPSEQPAIHREKDGTGFFVDDVGHMLTARHAVEDCASVVVVKEGKSLSAHVEALSPAFDIALIKVAKTMGLAAIFPRHAKPAVNELMFAAAYDKLSDIVARGGMLANATVLASSTGSEAGHLAIDSDVAHGASGAPVLDGRGLVEGVISRRTVSNRVLAVGAEQAKDFLAANGVRVAEDDRPQIAGGASRAHRAASISARVTCLQN